MKLESGKGGRHLEALGQETYRKTKMEDNRMGEVHGEEGEGIEQDGGQLDGRSTWGGGRVYRYVLSPCGLGKDQHLESQGSALGHHDSLVESPTF